MILDDLKNAARYYDLHPGFRAGFEFLASANLAALESGKVELQGDQLICNRDQSFPFELIAP